MLSIPIPGSATLELHFLVLDYNGTIAEDGDLLAEAADRIVSLSEKLQIYIVTADTHNTVAEKTASLPCKLRIIEPDRQDRAKQQFVERLGNSKTAAVGNGRNDALMVRSAALGIGLIQTEGASSALISSADIVCTNIKDALDLLLIPDRLKATLRN